jgi:hypothetical protein
MRINKEYRLTVPQKRQELRETFGFVPESVIREYAKQRRKAVDDWKLMHSLKGRDDLSANEIKYQKEVLARMESRGCPECEKKQQKKHIEKLEGTYDSQYERIQPPAGD